MGGVNTTEDAIVQCTFPVLYKEMQEKPSFDKKVTDWKNEMEKQQH